MIDFKDAKVNFSPIGLTFNVTPDSIGLSSFIKNAIENENKSVFRFYKEGYSETGYKDVYDKLIASGGRKIYEYQYRTGGECVFYWNDALIKLTRGNSKSIVVDGISCNDAITEVVKSFDSLFTAPKKKGYIFAITQEQIGMTLSRVGFAGTNLEKANYTQEVIKDYEYVIDDLKSSTPSGRIIILDGPPGTGKTHMTRSILMELSNAMYVVVPPNMVSSLSGPQLLPLLLQTKQSYNTSGPIILILEDADEVLAPRHHTEMSSISTILNLGDGIFGSLFDLRIIATTNSPAKEFDKAITRDGRLSKRIHIAPLAYEHANDVFKRLVNDSGKNLPIPKEEHENKMKPMVNKTTFTLAEIYKSARDFGYKPSEIPKEVENKDEELDDSVPDFSYVDEDDYLES